MASILHLRWLLLLLLPSVSPSASPHQRRGLLQSPSPQNIETFLPSLPSPAFAITPTPPPQPSYSDSSSSSTPTPSSIRYRKKIKKAVAATALTTFFVSFVIFFLLHKLLTRKHRRHRQQPAAKVFDSRSSSRGRRRSFSLPESSLKDVIVDETSLNVLYWRNLIGGSSTPVRCSYCKSIIQVDEPVEPPSAHHLDDKYRNRVQEQPLLPSNSISSSTSSAFSNSSKASPQPKSKSTIKPTPSPAPPPPPPPPPPPKAPPLPPPPPMTKKKPVQPPPMPPRPPTAAAAVSKTPRPPAAATAEGVRGRAKLKPLHWDKVTPANPEHSMVWDKISDGSFRFDDDLMDSLFGYTGNNQSAPNTNKAATHSNPFSSPATSSSTPAQVSLLDPRKSQNFAIVLRSIGISRQLIMDALAEGRGLSHEALEKLSRIAPTKEEEAAILGFSGNPTKLANVESFLYYLLKTIPSPFARVDAMLFRFNYDSEILHLKNSIQTLELACKELKSHGLFLKLLEAILKAGNRMNAGTARGNARAFNLSALCKLSDVKSTDGKTTLLHFVVEEVVRSEGKRLVINRNHSLRRSGSTSSSNRSGNLHQQEHNNNNKSSREEKEKEYMKLGLPIVGYLSEELANVKKAAAIDYDALLASCSSLGARIVEIRRVLGNCHGGEGFLKEMKGFLEGSEEELRVVIEEQDRVMELVKRTTEYYQPGASRDKNAQPLQLFVILRDFFRMFDRVCVDITRNLQRKKQQLHSVPASAESSPSATKAERETEMEKRPVARFPNLPPRFMSENSKSSSSNDTDSDNEF